MEWILLSIAASLIVNEIVDLVDFISTGHRVKKTLQGMREARAKMTGESSDS